MQNNFFDIDRQKKDSTVSLSENDANSPRQVTLYPRGGNGVVVDTKPE